LAGLRPALSLAEVAGQALPAFELIFFKFYLTTRMSFLAANPFITN
jgi:hypothetical protein